jgi:hypothetical protein
MLFDALQVAPEGALIQAKFPSRSANAAQAIHRLDAFLGSVARH